MRRALPMLLSAAVGMGLGFMLARPHTAIVGARAHAQTMADSKERGRLIAALEAILANAVDEVDEARLVDAAINGMVGILEFPATYLDTRRLRDLQVLGRRATGIGLEWVGDKGLARVVTPIEESPAAKAGVITNDIITHIDGTPLQGLALDDVAERMRGEAGTAVRLTILRKGRGEPIELSIVRNFYRLPPIRVRREDRDIGYVRVPSFNEKTIQALRAAMGELSAETAGGKLKGYLLDLRNTPGGLRDVTVAVADAFLDGGEIVSVRGRRPEQVERYHAQPGDIIDGKPLVVLINGGSAASAEIVAGALQHHQRATVVGSRSFGMGRVPGLVPLGTGNGALRLAVARYVLPSGRAFDGTGIAPDVEVAEEAAALATAHEVLRGVVAAGASGPAAKP
jgi:carboxyl-terminal processing protease